MHNKRYFIFWVCFLISLVVLVLALKDSSSLRIILAIGGFLAFMVLFISLVKKRPGS